MTGPSLVEVESRRPPPPRAAAVAHLIYLALMLQLQRHLGTLSSSPPSAAGPHSSVLCSRSSSPPQKALSKKSLFSTAGSSWPWNRASEAREQDLTAGENK